MKKILVILILMSIFILSGCFLFTDYDQNISLAENAIRSGSASNALNYANEALLAAETNEQKSKVNMIKGFAYYLLEQYASASNAFGDSLTNASNNESYSGKILSLFMLGSDTLALDYLDEVNTMPSNWSYEVNHELINQESLYNTLAISAKINGNQQQYDEIQSHLTIEFAAKLEAFFNE